MARKETCWGHSFRLAAPSQREDNTYHGFCYTCIYMNIRASVFLIKEFTYLKIAYLATTYINISMLNLFYHLLRMTNHMASRKILVMERHEIVHFFTVELSNYDVRISSIVP